MHYIIPFYRFQLLFHFHPINSFTTIRQTAPGKPNNPNYDTRKKVQTNMKTKSDTYQIDNINTNAS